MVKEDDKQVKIIEPRTIKIAQITDLFPDEGNEKKKMSSYETNKKKKQNDIYHNFLSDHSLRIEKAKLSEMAVK